MSLILELEPDVENALRDYAAAEGLSVNDLLARTFPTQRAAQQRNDNGNSGSDDPRARVQALLTNWQEADHTPTAAPAPSDGTMTPSEALFHKWDTEDDALTDAELQARSEQWEQFQQGINAERAHAGMRLVF